MDTDTLNTNTNMPQTLKQIREKQRANAKQYYEKKKADPNFRKKRNNYWTNWYARKKLKEQLEKEKAQE